MKTRIERTKKHSWWRPTLAILTALVLAACGGTSSDFTDGDGDGWSPEADCNDADPSIHPLAQEIPYDGIDQDCDGADLTDVDRDGYDGLEAGGTDCDDGDARRAPGNPEIPYDGIDQDCDGTDLTDVDGDTHDGEEAGGDDCDDRDAQVYPGATEIPGDGIDQDCDGEDSFVVDGDADGDGYASAALNEGLDCDDTDPEIYPGAIERCNGLDDDCDGDIDEGLLDWDADGAAACVDCDDWDPAVRPDLGDHNPWSDIPYNGIDEDCSGADLQDVDGDDHISTNAGGDDCNDNNPDIHPLAAEICNNIDDNCDGNIDEGFADVDSDGDLVKDCMDCAPNDASIRPGNLEMPDNDADDDCDGYTDELDIDNDARQGGDDQGLAPDCCDTGNEASVPGCTPLTADSISGGEFAFAEIPYDGIDQDCSGADLTDVDGDGFDSVLIEGGTDCDDNNPEAYPGHAEDCLDPGDNNCDGTANENCGAGFDEDLAIAAGTFIRGRNADEAAQSNQDPPRAISMDAFFIDKYEVTISQYWRCVAANHCEFTGADLIESATDVSYWYNQEKGLHPAINLDWNQAQAYCQWVGKQLPTEAQWEMTARGLSPDERSFPWGEPNFSTPPDASMPVRDPLDCDIANHADLCTSVPCVGDVAAVDEYPGGVSPFGAFNMAGNVSEWVLDWYQTNYYAEAISPSDNPTGPANGTSKVFRGGAWNNVDYHLETTYRDATPRLNRMDNVGFRCARTPPVVWTP
ncbi:MAG: SUMF1/EgtB/PvdO family nonheme iron enzyme [Deltaproteobacteria bacterium]|nr:SUMF1/EgtB/PvdO family nonheme iron enzyme [Deltaproteobacteria bacterium]